MGAVFFMRDSLCSTGIIQVIDNFLSVIVVALFYDNREFMADFYIGIGCNICRQLVNCRLVIKVAADLVSPAGLIGVLRDGRVISPCAVMICGKRISSVSCDKLHPFANRYIFFFRAKTAVYPDILRDGKPVVANP